MLTAIQTYEGKGYCKLYFADTNDNIKKQVVICKVKDLLNAIN